MAPFCRWGGGGIEQWQAFHTVDAKALLREVSFHSCWINTGHKENALKYWRIVLKSQYKSELLHLVHKEGSECQSLPAVWI